VTKQNNKSKLLFDSNPLIILPELAVLIGLNESIILQQIHYWLQKSEHIHDGHVWVYNSIPQWCEQFPFLSQRSIERAIANLRNKSLVLTTDKYNKLRQDRTLWYTINYEVLEALQEKPSNPHGNSSRQNDGMGTSQGEEPSNPHEISSRQNGGMPLTKWRDASRQNGGMHHAKMAVCSTPPQARNTNASGTFAPSPEITTEITTKITTDTHTVLGEKDITPVQNEQAQEKQNPVCEDALSTEKLRQDTKAFLKGDRDRIPLAQDGISEQEATPTNTKTDLTRTAITTHTVPQTPMAKPKEKPVHNACKPLSLQELQKAISETIGENFGLHQLKLLVRTKGQQKIQYHLAHWHIHRQRQTKSAAGYFNYVVINDMEPVLPEKKPYYQGNQVNTIPQRDNFEQRDYSDEFLESFYANLTD
jgi:hypothetical protein